ncbi:MAG: hypothetical protein IPG74_14545 [Flavobacteriales bacterium]|nr:hypothetical protein [Flavobacteriales bacterium]
MLWANSSAEEAPYLTLNNARRAGYPILWGIGSFLFMWYGMRTKLKTVRVSRLCSSASRLKLFLASARHQRRRQGGGDSSAWASCCWW